MGNVIQGLNQDGQNSGTFLGTYHNVGSTTTNFTGANVNFTGTNQNIVVGYTGSTGTITYWNSPSFMTGASFPDGTRVTLGNTAFLDANGKINSSFIPTNTTSSTVNTITVNQSVSGTGSINLPQGSITGATGYFQNLNSNNAAADLNLFPSHTGNIWLGNDASGSYIYLKNNIYASSSSKGIYGGFFNGYSSNTNVSLGGNTNQGNVNVGKDITSGNVNLGNSAASGTGTINLYQNVTAAKNLTLSNTNGIISAPTHTGSNYYVGTSLTGPGAINTTGNITTSETISGASFTGSNYYLGTQMTGPGRIDVSGTLTADKIIIKNPSNSIDLQGTGDFIRINGARNATSGIAIYNGLSVNDGAGLAVGSWTPPGIGNISATGTVSAASFTSSGSSGFEARNGAGIGYSTLKPGNASNPGYAEFRKADGTRRGYVGWDDGGYISLGADDALGYKTNKELVVSGTITNNGGMTGTGNIWTSGNIVTTGGLNGSGLNVSTGKVSATSANSGGVRINGQNKWVIGENSVGQLCFYNMSASNTTTTTPTATPLACITATGNLVAGTG